LSTLERLKLIKDVLGRDYISIEVASLSIDDDCYGGCTADVQVCLSGSTTAITLSEGGGIGMVDAIFDSFKRYFVKEYISLEGVSMRDFQVKESGKKDSQGKPHCHISFRATTTQGYGEEFSASSHSLAAGSARVVASAMEFFVNSEKAFVALHRALSDARERGRSDLVTRYTRELAEVVKSTSYEAVVP
jgi:hypothetical protein